MLNTLFESIKPIAANLFLYSPFQYPAGSSKDDGYNNTNINKLSPAQSTPTLHAISALVSPADKIDIFSAGEKRGEKSVCSPQVTIPETIRDEPLEKFCGEGQFSSRRNFFSLSNSLYEFFLGYSMNIF